MDVIFQSELGTTMQESSSDESDSVPTKRRRYDTDDGEDTGS